MGPDKKPISKGQAWFCTTGLPSDILIDVDDMTFHLHKFPLMSKSRKLHNLITEREQTLATTGTAAQRLDGEVEIRQEEEEEEEEEQLQIALPDFPGGSDAFETAAKFCYGVKIDLSAATAAALICAGDYLEMTEEYSEDNLVSRADRFISQSVLRNVRHSIKALASCQGLMPAAEKLMIVQRCIDAIADKAATTDPSLFGWPVNDGAAANYKGAARTGDTWLDELGFLSLTFFKRLISAMKALNLNGEIIESCLIHYAKKYIPGISRVARKPASSLSTTASAATAPPTEKEQRELLETIVSNLPKEKISPSSSNSTRLLFGLLRTAYILKASEACRFTLEKKIGSQLEHATLDDLLIPSYSYLNETLYDVDCVERILGHFLDGREERSATRIEEVEEGTSITSTALMLVGKLIDGYLSEIASDANLKPDKFYNIAISLPDHARFFDDGLYRAVDVYLKAHSWISEAEREKICGVLDCQKLTLEACTHAAQNERLPLRAVVQVLFFEQLQLRHAIAGTLLAADGGAEGDRLSNHSGGEEENELAVAVVPHGRDGGTTWRATVRENQVLRVNMDSMQTRVHELEKECSTMKKVLEKIDKMGQRGQVEKAGWRTMFGCKFKTQVCDSHESTVVDTRKVRGHRRGNSNGLH